MAISNSNDRFNGYVASLAFKAPVKRALTTNRDNLSGAITVDGYVFQNGDRILLTAQTNAVENGIWLVNTSSAWTRAPDFDGNRDAAHGTLVTSLRSAGLPYSWVLDTADPIVIGTTETSWSIWTDPSGAASDLQAVTDAGNQTTNSIFLAEKAAAEADRAGFGQLWVNNNPFNPSVLYFTDETGNDINLVEELWNNGTRQAWTNLLGIVVRDTLYVGDTSGVIKIREQTNADVDEANYGQLWVKDDAPNVLYFTDDTGIDQLIDPSVSQVVGVTASRNLVLSDKGKTIRFSGAVAAQVMTIPANSSVAYPEGTFLGFDNSGSVDIQVAITTDTLTWADDGTTGTRTIAAGGYAVAQKITSTSWKIAGKQIT